jgi:aryl-alcohol dehydrogenase-like predicted oxidoreductase
MIPGHATPPGTLRFRERFPELSDVGHFRLAENVPGVADLWLSSLGIGTYMGEPEPSCDQLYVQAVDASLRMGVNIIDTAINFRHQRSERNIGTAIKALVSGGVLARDEFLVCTKAGYLAFDGEIPLDQAGYFKREYLDQHIFHYSDVAGHMHCMAPRFLADQLGRSRANLGLETIDVFYLHNPESQLRDVKQEEFLRRLLAAFHELEKAVSHGHIRWYGIASWNAFRDAPGQEQAMSLEECANLATRAGGRNHHMRFVQLPFNLAMTEAYASKTQSVGHQMVSVLDAARALGIAVVGSASLHQSHLATGVPERLKSRLRSNCDATCALQFARSAPGVTTALVGMSHPEHVEQNLAVAKRTPMPEADWKRLFVE